MRLKDKVAIVTGGGSGIGTAYCERFLDEGARVIISDIGEAQAKAVAERLAARGSIDFVHTDIADEASVADCAAATLDRFGRIDVLVNNAAIYGELEGANQSLEYLKKVFEVNVHGQWLMARAVAPAMVRQRWGRIINVASIAGYMHQIARMTPNDPENFELSNYSYFHSKFSVLGLTRFMASQLGPHNVTVNCIAPGLTLTEATERQVPTGMQPFFAQQTAMGKNVEARHMTGTAVYFASEDSEMVTGQVICVDGGNIMPV
jgi:NAD(P)-dependent dehydrogenase (short-subunit alcohol dehydrogenase family)